MLVPPAGRLRDLALLLLLSCLWAASYTFIRIGVTTIPPLTFIAGRTAIAGTVLAVAARIAGVRVPKDPRLWLAFVGQALLNTVFPFVLVAWSERTVEAGVAVILNAMTPIFVFFLTLLITRHEPITLQKAIGTASGFLGVILVVGPQALHGLGRQVLAQLAIILSSLFYATAVISGKRFKDVDPLLVAAGSLLSGAAILTPIALCVDHSWTVRPSLASVGALCGLALFSTALAFWIYFNLINRIGSVATTATAYLRVPFGVFIGVGVLGETLKPTTWAGMAFVVVGVFAMTTEGLGRRAVAQTRTSLSRWTARQPSDG